MKRVLLMMLVVILVFVVTSCATVSSTGRMAEKTETPQATESPVTTVAPTPKPDPPKPTAEVIDEQEQVEDTAVIPEESELADAEEEELQKEAEQSEDTKETAEKLVDGMRPEFKEAMDSYEAFFDEYCEFMQTYKENPTDLKLIGKYAEMVARELEMNEKIEELDNGDLNNEELKYYIEVTSRITQKMLDVTAD